MRQGWRENISAFDQAIWLVAWVTDKWFSFEYILLVGFIVSRLDCLFVSSHWFSWCWPPNVWTTTTSADQENHETQEKTIIKYEFIKCRTRIQEQTLHVRVWKVFSKKLTKIIDKNISPDLRMMFTMVVSTDIRSSPPRPSTSPPSSTSRTCCLRCSRRRTTWTTPSPWLTSWQRWRRLVSEGSNIFAEFY